MVDRPLLPLVGGRAVARPGTGLNTETTKLLLKDVLTQLHLSFLRLLCNLLKGIYKNPIQWLTFRVNKALNLLSSFEERAGKRFAEI